MKTNTRLDILNDRNGPGSNITKTEIITGKPDGILANIENEDKNIRDGI